MGARRATRGRSGAGGNALRVASLLVAGSLLAVLLAEAGLTLLVPSGFWNPPVAIWEWVVEDPVLGWANAPGYRREEFGINGLGLRGEELSVAKPPGVTRVVLMGDSVTFGLIKEGQGRLAFHGYAGSLAEMLARQGRSDVEIVNAGVLGYSVANGVVQLQTRLLRLAPDVLVVRFGLNDHAGPSGRPPPAQEPGSRLGRVLFAALPHWRLLQLARMAVVRRDAQATSPTKRPVEPVLEPEEFAARLRRIVELAKGNGVHVLLVDYPIRAASRGASLDSHPADLRIQGVSSIEELHALHERYQQAQRRVAAETGTPLLETAPACREVSPACFNDYDLPHPTREGAQLIARLLLEDLVARGWIPSR